MVATSLRPSLVRASISRCTTARWAVSSAATTDWPACIRMATSTRVSTAIGLGLFGSVGLDGSTGSGTHVGGMMVYGGDLITSVYDYYDTGSPPQSRAFFVKPDTNLAHQNATGAYDIHTDGGSAGFIDGWMAPIPAGWQAALGGPVASGNCCLAIISRTSLGPAAFSSPLGQSRPADENRV